MALEIGEPGLYTTIQDRGRFGYYKYGIPQSGSMDQFSAGAANRLVGNTPDEAVLECTYMGPVFTTDEDAVLAVTGAPVDVLVNDKPVEQWRRIELAAGDTVRFGLIRGGMKFYVAVCGGIDVPAVLGSRSTYSIGMIGGLDGTKLERGDRLEVGRPPDSGLPRLDELRDDPPAYEKDVEIRIVLGLYDIKLAQEGIDNLLGEVWTLTPVADRMGLRYKGPGVVWKDAEQPFGAGQDPSNIVDAGYAVGSIQIPGGTQPIILHREAVSGGGYAMVGTVISADMDRVARGAPGTRTRFVSVTMEEALAARADDREAWRRVWS